MQVGRQLTLERPLIAIFENTFSINLANKNKVSYIVGEPTSVTPKNLYLIPDTRNVMCSCVFFGEPGLLNQRSYTARMV